MFFRRVGKFMVGVVTVLGADKPFAQLGAGGVENPGLRTALVDDAVGAACGEDDEAC
jgi:hypothetical protein